LSYKAVSRFGTAKIQRLDCFPNFKRKNFDLRKNVFGVNIEIWSFGKESDGYIDEGIRNYFKKTAPWASVSLVILSAGRKVAGAEVPVQQRAEEELLLKRLQPGHYFVLLDERGKMLTSPQWATQMQHCMNQGVKTLVILIGGAFGVTDNVRARARQVWSLSALVFPHQLVRLIAAEQIYRAFSILNNSPYHHE